MRDERPLAVFLPDGGDGYLLRYEFARPRVARDGRVYTRRTVQPASPALPKWYIYAEHPMPGVKGATAGAAPSPATAHRDEPMNKNDLPQFTERA